MTATTAEVAPTAPPTAFTDAETGGRVYIHPRTGEAFISATTALGIVDKAALPYWYGKQSAITALEQLPAMIAATRILPCGTGVYCGRCLTCIAATIRRAGNTARDTAADRGSRFHHVAEQYALTGQWIGHDADIAGNVAQLKRFTAIHRVEFEAAEVTVINRTHGWAGTLDAIVTCGWMPPKHRDLIGVPMLADYKTGASIYPIAGLQLAAYRHGEAVLLPDGTEMPLPGTHADTALSVQIRPEDFWVRPCPVGPAAYTKFLRALDLWRDINTPDLDLVGRAMTKPRARKET